MSKSIIMHKVSGKNGLHYSMYRQEDTITLYEHDLNNDSPKLILTTESLGEATKALLKYIPKKQIKQLLEK